MLIATVDTNLPLIQQLLIERGILDAKKLAASRNTPPLADESPERWLCRLHLANDHEIADAYAEYLGIPLYDPPESEEIAIDHSLARYLPEKLCRTQFVAPVAVRENAIDVAFVSPDQLLVLDEIELLTGKNVSPMIAPLGVVDGLIEALFSAECRRQVDPLGGKIRGSRRRRRGVPDDEIQEILDIDAPPPPGRSGKIVRMVNQILRKR